MPVLTGLDVAARTGLKLPGQGRVAVLCNNATVDHRLRGTIEVLREIAGLHLERIFSPQHGFAGEKQDNMVESSDGIHPETGIPLVSLYGRIRVPETAMLDGLDAFLIDLPDVGTRVYTFLSTALYCLQTCSQAGIPVFILDRPNPIGGDLAEGPLLDPAFASFVGVIPIPLRHGLTVGEACLFGAAALDLRVDLQVIRAEGWMRSQWHDATGIPWIMPSPNLPTLDGTIVYPGMVMLEGTNLSEGRGTTRPFEIFGAPWLDPVQVRRWLNGGPCREGAENGYQLRPVAFEPTFHKFAGQNVRGFQIHVTDRKTYRPVATTTALLAAIMKAHPGAFAWKEPPYEYEFVKSPIDLIAGTDRLRLSLEAGADPEEIAATWTEPVDRFLEERRRFLLYT